MLSSLKRVPMPVDIESVMPELSLIQLKSAHTSFMEQSNLN